MPHQLVAHLDQDGQRQVENVRQAVARLFAAPSHRHALDHGPAHADRVVALLDGLTEALMARRESTRGREYALAGTTTVGV